MPGKLRFDMELGTVPRTTARKSDADPLRILILADLSGQEAGGRTEAASLTSRKISSIDIDNFDQVFARIAPTLHLEPLPGQVVDLELESLDDFHRDALYRDRCTIQVFAVIGQRSIAVLAEAESRPSDHCDTVESCSAMSADPNRAPACEFLERHFFDRSAAPTAGQA